MFSYSRPIDVAALNDWVSQLEGDEGLCQSDLP